MLDIESPVHRFAGKRIPDYLNRCRSMCAKHVRSLVCLKEKYLIASDVANSSFGNFVNSGHMLKNTMTASTNEAS